MSASTWKRVEFEDSVFAVRVARPVQAIQEIVRIDADGGRTLPLEQRSGETGLWNGHVWVPLRWVWRQIWRQGELT